MTLFLEAGGDADVEEGEAVEAGLGSGTEVGREPVAAAHLHARAVEVAPAAGHGLVALLVVGNVVRAGVAVGVMLALHAEGDGGIGVDMVGVHAEELAEDVVVGRGAEGIHEVLVGVVEAGVGERAAIAAETELGAGTEAEALDVEGVLEEFVLVGDAQRGGAGIGAGDTVVAHAEGDDVEPFADLRRQAGCKQKGEEGENDSFHRMKDEEWDKRGGLSVVGQRPRGCGSWRGGCCRRRWRS